MKEKWITFEMIWTKNKFNLIKRMSLKMVKY